MLDVVVAKALLKILRGIGLRRRALSSLEGDQFRLDDLSGHIQELEDELERTGSEGTQGRRAFVDRFWKQQDKLRASLCERTPSLRRAMRSANDRGRQTRCSASTH